MAGRFPAEIERMHLANLDRTLSDVGLVLHRRGTAVRLLDLGGGISLFAAACALVGIDVALVDDFADPSNVAHGPDLLHEHRAAGVEIIQRDVVSESVPFEPSSLDVVVSFHSIEHWHHSPKRLFADIRSALRPGGLFVLAGPNCVNLRKRVTALLGHAKWSAMEDWYEQGRFRGHVREPDVGDLRYIAADMRLDDVEVFGRNWLGYRSPHRVTRKVTAVADRALRTRPTLCSDIYMVGVKPAQGA
jgi:SAM-dependent methyltransferase